MANKKHIEPLVIASALLVGSCSDNPIGVEDTKYECTQYKCDVFFHLVNSDEIEHELEYLVRAHDRVSKGGNSVSNMVVAEKRHQLNIQGGEKIMVEESIEVGAQPYQVVVTAWKK